jgi:hypothetical protein
MVVDHSLEKQVMPNPAGLHKSSQKTTLAAKVFLFLWTTSYKWSDILSNVKVVKFGSLLRRHGCVTFAPAAPLGWGFSGSNSRRSSLVLRHGRHSERSRISSDLRALA